MPHKHKRKRGLDDAQLFDLPPTKAARPLSSARNSRTEIASSSKGIKNKSRGLPKPHAQSAYGISDDTPRAFASMMARQRALDGLASQRKGSAEPSQTRKVGSKPRIIRDAAEDGLEGMHEGVPRILPGERLKDFDARVDAALPVQGLQRKFKSNDPSGAGKRLSKRERQLNKMRAEWRRTQAAREAKTREARAELEDEQFERELAAGAPLNFFDSASDNDSKPKARQSPRKGRRPKSRTDTALVGLHDVVLAPPQLSKPSRGI